MQSSLGVKQNSYYTTKRENYFFDYVKQELIDRYGANTVRKGGLKVYTTVDLDLQKAARKAIAGPALPARRPQLRHRQHRPAHRHPRDGLVGQVRQEQVQLRGPGPPAARLDREGLGAHDGAANGVDPDSTTTTPTRSTSPRPSGPGRCRPTRTATAAT
jgi:penicillin-binding protein 1A